MLRYLLDKSEYEDIRELWRRKHPQTLQSGLESGVKSGILHTTARHSNDPSTELDIIG
jgi:hypothetical protein